MEVATFCTFWLLVKDSREVLINTKHRGLLSMSENIGAFFYIKKKTKNISFNHKSEMIFHSKSIFSPQKKDNTLVSFSLNLRIFA